jgi:hypothetical protein
VNPSEVKGVLMGCSVNFQSAVKNSLPGERARGASLVTLFLDTVLRDSCSEEVQEAFLNSMREMLLKARG